MAVLATARRRRAAASTSEILSHLQRQLAAAISHLTAERARFALVGGLAVSVRAETRFTLDLDFVVAVENDRAAELLVAAMQRRGYAIEAALEQTTVGRLSTIRLRPGEASGPAAMVDLLFASTGIEEQIVAAATRAKLPGGLEVPVAAVGHLIAMKIVAMDDLRRPQDRADIVALVACADPTEIARARESVHRIEALGYSRGRDLGALLAPFLPAPFS